MTSSSGLTLLSAAATALKSSGSGVSINSQIDTVANALTGTKRTRESVFQGEGYPPEAKNILEILKIQINKAVSSLGQQDADEKVYHKLVEDLEVIESFADRIIKFYDPQGKPLPEGDEELKLSVRESFTKAKAEALTSIALNHIYSKMSTLENWYRNNPNLTQHEYRLKLDDLSAKIRKWEDELLPGDPVLRDSQTIAARIYRLKSKLHDAIELAELQDHPGIVGESGLEILRVATEILQQAKNQFEVEQAVSMAQEANRNLKRSGKEYQEKGIAFNLLIHQSIASFVDRQIRSMEKELDQPLYFSLDAESQNEDLANRLISQMERLMVYFEYVKKWAGFHQEDLQERIALVYEQIVSKARKIKYLTLDEAMRKGTSADAASTLAKLASRFRKAEKMGKDLIKPHEIFNDKRTLADRLRELIHEIPELQGSQPSPISYNHLGRIYRKLFVIRGQAGGDPSVQSKIAAALAKIEKLILPQQLEIDIYNEFQVRKEYFEQVLFQEVNRFLILLGIDPSLTNPEKYAGNPNPSEYPFKGNQLAKILRNHRILWNFLEGRYGHPEQNQALRNVCQDFYEESELFCAKIKLELLKRMKLSISKCPGLEEIEVHLAGRSNRLPVPIQLEIKEAARRIESSEGFSGLPEGQKKESIELQALWMMLEYLKTMKTMQESGSMEQRIFSSCSLHLETARQILLPLLANQSSKIKKLILDNVPALLQDAARLDLSLDPKEIVARNQENQFYKDHALAEIFPLYAEGHFDPRKEGENMQDRVVRLSNGCQALAECIQSLATQSLFEAALLLVKENLDTLIGIPGVHDFSCCLEERTLFISPHPTEPRATLTGCGILIFFHSPAQQAEREEIGSMVIRITIDILNQEAASARLTFHTDTFNQFVTEFRDNKSWTPF